MVVSPSLSRTGLHRGVWGRGHTPGRESTPPCHQDTRCDHQPRATALAVHGTDSTCLGMWGANGQVYTIAPHHAHTLDRHLPHPLSPVIMTRSPGRTVKVKSCGRQSVSLGCSRPGPRHTAPPALTLTSSVPSGLYTDTPSRSRMSPFSNTGALSRAASALVSACKMGVRCSRPRSR